MDRKVKLGIITGIILVLAVGTVSLISTRNSHKVTSRDPKLNGATTSIYDSSVAELKNQLKNAKTDEEKSGILTQIGTFQYLLGKFQDSSDTLNHAIQLNPKNIGAYTALYQTQYQMGDFNAALQTLQTATTVDSTNADIWKKYIDLEQNKLGASTEQINELYASALNGTKNNIDLVIDYAKFEEQFLRNPQVAQVYWQKAIQIDPIHKKSYQTEIDRINAILNPPAPKKIKNK
jgi:tetratricopeptide (TPR) repeat protein